MLLNGGFDVGGLFQTLVTDMDVHAYLSGMTTPAAAIVLRGRELYSYFNRRDATIAGCITSFGRLCRINKFRLSVFVAMPHTLSNAAALAGWDCLGETTVVPGTS